LTQTPLQGCCHQPQPKTRIEFAAIMRATTSQTCNCTFDPAHTRKIAPATWTPVKIAPSTFTDWERQIVTPLLVANPKIAASLPPFNTMRQDPAPTRTKLRQDMRQFVAQSSVDLSRMMNELGIQRDQFGAIIGSAGSCFET
jgi:hypothetical protein